jgi:hypothetical protein
LRGLCHLLHNDRYDLAFQAVQELLEFALDGSHAEVEAMNTIFCGHVSLLLRAAFSFAAFAETVSQWNEIFKTVAMTKSVAYTNHNGRLSRPSGHQ